MNDPSAAGACDICRIHASAADASVDELAGNAPLAPVSGASDFAALECHRGPHWIVRHHPLPSPLVGWTCLCAVRHVQGPADFHDAEADEFGRALRTVSRAIREVTGCDRVYAIAFGQGAPHLHMHLIPRFDSVEATRAWQIADWYRAVERGEHAPADPAAVADFVASMRDILASNPPGATSSGTRLVRSARTVAPPRAASGPRLTAKLRADIHESAVEFVAARYQLTADQRATLAATPIRWRRGRGASAYYQRHAHGFDRPHILLRVAPGASAYWHTYRRARARYSTPPGGIELETRILAIAVLIHELTHALQHGACGHGKRAFSEVETTENEIEFIRQHAPQAFAKLIPVVRRTRKKVRGAPPPPSGLAALRAIVLRAAGTLAGLIQPRKPAVIEPRSTRRRTRSPKPTGS